MKGFRRKIGSVRPDDCAADRIKAAPREKARIEKRFKDWPVKKRHNLDAAACAVVENKLQ